MYIHDERLPGEDGEKVIDGSKTVRLTLTSRHIMTRHLEAPASMFGVEGAEEKNDYDDIPEGFSPDAIADFDADYEDDGSEYAEDGDEVEADSEDAADELYHRLEELADMLGDDGGDDTEDDTFVFKTLAEMRVSKDAHGAEAIEISYIEDESMEDTRTLIVYTPSQNGRVSVIHSGAVMSSLICERGVRHISAYKTPVMPFEVAVYAKKCDGSINFETGGSLELDYLVELRGMDIQRTQMTIDVVTF